MPAVLADVPDPVAQTLKRRIGGYVKNGNHEAAARMRAELELHHLERRIRRAVDLAPPLPAAERERLALLLAPAPGAVAHGS